MMAVVKHLDALLGIDVGGMQTRVSLFGIAEGKYRLLGCENAATSLGQGLHIGAGVAQAMQALQECTDHTFLKDEGGLMLPVDRIGRGVDQVALVTSAGPRVRTALLGLSSGGSLKAGGALIDSLPLEAVQTLGMANLGNETHAIESLIQSRPEILVITGGEDAGAEDLTRQWIEIARTVCVLLPATLQPMIVYAGNPTLESTARRRLEPVARLLITSNLQPARGMYDLVPAQGALELEVLRSWEAVLHGLTGLSDLSKGLNGITGRASGRMLRFLSQSRHQDQAKTAKTGVLAVDLGGVYTTVSAGLSGLSGTVIQDKFPDLSGPDRHNASQVVYEWASEPATLAEAERFLCNHALIPTRVPETRQELAFSYAFARYRLRQACARMSEHYAWFDYHPEWGLQGHFEPVIASGAVLTHAGDLGRVMLALLDGLQPRGITTMVLDRHHLLPLLGKIGEAEPMLPVHVLSSMAFENLGTVVSAVGSVPAGKTALTLHVETETGKYYSVDVPYGSVKRLVLPPGETAELECIPHHRVDIGFGGYGQRGRLKVTGGLLGVVIDARGRPLQLPEAEEARITLIQGWLRTLGVEHE